MKVCIIGNGLTSLSLAQTLVNLGLKVDLFSDNHRNNYDKLQTIGISKSNIDFFNKKILNIDHLLWDINRIEIFTENSHKENILDFQNQNKQLFSTIRNNELYSNLLLTLKKNKLFNIKKKIKTILLKKNYELIINCDLNDAITKKFFYNKFSKNYNSIGHVTIFEHKELNPNNIATQIFTSHGPIAFLPVSKTETSIVYSVRGKKKIEKNELKNLIKKNFEKYEVKKIYDFKSFELKSADLRVYYYENILAFGDLLHRLHPLAGQGFNMVLRDIKILSKIINFKMNLGIQLDSSVFSEFEKLTKHHNYLFSNSINLIYEFFHLESKIKNRLFSKSIKTLGKNKVVNKFLIKTADTGIII